MVVGVVRALVGTGTGVVTASGKVVEDGDEDEVVVDASMRVA